MGVKSTQQLSYDEAIEKYVELRMQQSQVRQQFEEEAKLMDMGELTSLLTEMDDDLHGGESYRNYQIG